MAKVTPYSPRLELGDALRALRRRADLSQRELAVRSGVPQATLARIESGRTTDPKFRTVERLVRAANGRLELEPSDPVAETTNQLSPVTYREWRDQAGRRFPAHLDVREVHDLRDWPGAWWAHWYNLPPERWPLRVPEATYDLCRARRDRRRWREWVRQELRYRRVTDGLPDESCRLVADLPDGTLVGELRAHQRSVELLVGADGGDRREMVLDGVLVAPALRGLGVGRQLVGLLSEEMRRANIVTGYAIAEFHGIDFLLSCGFQLTASRPAALCLELDRSTG